MGTNERLFWRELGCQRPSEGRSRRQNGGIRPLVFERSFTSSEGLIKRLAQTDSFTGDAASVSNLTWSPDGQFLAAGGEDCRITVWEPGYHRQSQTIDIVRFVAIVASASLQGCLPALLWHVRLKRPDAPVQRSQGKPRLLSRGTPRPSIACVTCPAATMSTLSQQAMTRRSVPAPPSSDCTLAIQGFHQASSGISILCSQASCACTFSLILGETSPACSAHPASKHDLRHWLCRFMAVSSAGAPGEFDKEGGAALQEPQGQGQEHSCHRSRCARDMLLWMRSSTHTHPGPLEHLAVPALAQNYKLCQA